MALVIKTKGAKATVTKQQKNKGDVIVEDTVEQDVALPEEFSANEGTSGPFCEVGVDASYTHNLGNYQSARVGVSLRVPCIHTEVDDMFDYAKEWVNAKMESMIEELPSSGN